tara:strand:+ start:276 stop:515 length:240 start_codon:yes stop_codon:yes gene_type:complete
MGLIQTSQYNTTIEEFIGLKKLYPMGKYKVSSGDCTNRTTWFEFSVPINKVTMEITWFLDSLNISEQSWRTTCEELELI